MQGGDECLLACLLVEIEQRAQNCGARGVVALFEDLGVEEEHGRGEEVDLREVDELEYDRLRASLQVKVHDDLLERLGLGGVFVVLNDVVLDDLVGQLPVLQLAGHYEGL